MQSPQILPIERAVDQQPPIQRPEQPVQVDLVLLVNDALVAINERQWESLKELLEKIIEITNTQSLLEDQFSQIKALVRKLPNEFAEENVTLIRLIADYLSSRPLIHRLGRDRLGHPVRWECDLLLSMQWLQAAIGLAKEIGKTDLLNLLYNQADRLFARFVILEVIEDEVWMGAIETAGNLIDRNCWRSDYKILDYIRNLKSYCHPEDFLRVIHRLLKHVIKNIPEESSVERQFHLHRAEAAAIGQVPIDGRERIQVSKLCQENTATFCKDLMMIGDEDSLSVRAKQLAIFNRYHRYFRETFIPHLQALLGPPPSPCRYHVMAMGSVGREEITPLADLECFILMEEKKLTEEEKNRDNRRTLEENYHRENGENRRYFKKMGRLLELLVLSVGDWFSTTIPSFDLQGESLMKGFHIDPTKGAEEELWESNVLVITIDEAKALILRKGNLSYPEEEFAKYGNDQRGNCYSLLKSSSLYSFDGSEELFQDYQREIKQLLCSSLPAGESVKTCGEKIIRYTLKKRCGEFSRYRGDVLHGTVDLKEIIFRPFTLLLTDLHTFLCGSEDSTATLAQANTLDLIDELTSLFTSDSIELLKVLAEELHSLRINLHTHYEVTSGAIKDEASFDGSSLTHYTLTSQQQRVIRTAHQLILKPLYAKIEEIISRGYALSSIDLVYEGVEDVLQLFEQGKNNALNHRLRLWMTLPISLQLSFYRALSAVGTDEHFREIFIDGIEKMLPKEQLEVFLQVTHSMTGYRQKERIARRDLQQAILAITTTAEETPYLVVTPFIHEPRYLKRTVADSIIDRGDLKSEYAAVSGNRVCSLSHEGVNIHLKQAPDQNNGSPFFPGKEQGVNRLMMRLFGRGCSFSELVYLTNTSTQKGYFVLISQTLFGVNLNDIIENPPALAHVDHKQLTELFLSIPLVLPGDHRPVNFMVKSTITPKGQTNSQLICVDNDVAWVRPIQAERNFIGQIKYTINIYAPLFFLFPNFNLDQEAIKEFLLLRPTFLLKAWFEEMIALNASYQQTFGRYLPSIIFPYFALEKAMGGQLFVQFCHLQSYLQKHFDQAIQAEELFKTFISYGAGHSVDVGKILFDKYTTEKNTAGSISDKVKRITGRDSTKSLSLSQSTKAMFSHLTLDADILRPDQSIKELNFLSLYIDKIRIVQQENGLYKVEKGFSEVIRPNGSPDLATQAALIDTIAAITCDKLDLSDCLALTDMALIRILETSGHHLIYLNLRQCPSITDQSISLLAKYCPYLEELYLSGCPRITSLSSSNFVGLKTEAHLLFLRILHISRCNQLRAIDLRSYALMTLKADNNPNLTDVDLDVLESPDTHFDHCPKLKQEWFSKLADRIASHKKQYGKKVCPTLIQVYRNDNSFTTLHLKNSHMSAASVASLAKALEHNSSLTTLYLENSYMSAASVASLAKALEHNSSLKTLNLKDKDIDNTGAFYLAEALLHNSSLTTLNLTDNKIDADGTVSLAKALQHNNSLSTLHLGSNNIGDTGAAFLSETLLHNSSLTTLDLTGNKIGTDGFNSLSKALKHNSSLSTLHLWSNNIDNTGAASLAETLQHNSSLKTLNLQGNNLGGAGIASLTKALQHNNSLTTLNLGWNNIGNAGATSLAKALHYNRSLTMLDLQSNNIGDEGTASLTKALQHNNSLTTLNLDWNDIYWEIALEMINRLKGETSSFPDSILKVNTSAIGIEEEKRQLSSSSNDCSTSILTQEQKLQSSLSPFLPYSSIHKVGTGLENSHNNCFFNAIVQLIMNSSLKDFFLNRDHLIVPSEMTTQDQIDRAFAFLSGMDETYTKACQASTNSVHYDSSEMRSILGLSLDGQEDVFQAFNALCHFYNLNTLSIPLSFTTKVNLATKTPLEATPNDPIEIGDDGLSSSPRVEQCLTHPLALDKIPTKIQKLIEETFSREEICDQPIPFIHRSVPYSVAQFTRQLHFDSQDLKDELLFHVLRFNKRSEKMMAPLPEDLFEVRFGSGMNTVIYSLIGFIVHKGKTLESGHYVAYVKSAEGWTQWSDTASQFFYDNVPIQEASSSLAASSSSSSLPRGASPHSKIIAAAREAYILHYHKKSPSEDNSF